MFQARSWQTIKAMILQSIASNAVLAPELTSNSPVAQWNNWAFEQALLSNTNEQAAVVFVDEVEQRIAMGHAQTAAWIQAQVLLFQYNTAVGYLVQVTDGITIGYATITPADRIISNCAVVAKVNGALIIKVTTGVPAAALSSNQKIALNSYLTNFLSPNQSYSILSVAADQLRISGVVYYNGQLNVTVQNNVISALNAYITAFSTSQALGGSFNGLVKVSDIAKVIEGVEGVVDWQASQITMTPVVGVPTNLVFASTQLARSYQTYSGYVKEDVTNPFLSTITFSAANN